MWKLARTGKGACEHPEFAALGLVTIYVAFALRLVHIERQT